MKNVPSTLNVISAETIQEQIGAHTLVWGGEAFRTDTAQLRAGLSTNFTTRNTGTGRMCRYGISISPIRLAGLTGTRGRAAIFPSASITGSEHE